MKHLIYLHGFKSSPSSHKAVCLQKAIENRSDVIFSAPQLHGEPQVVLQQLLDNLSHLRNDNIYLIGSSLGGYFATYLSEQFNFPATLVNPAINPYDFDTLIGEHTHPETGESFAVTAAHLQQFRQFDVKTITQPRNFLLLLKTGDEVLDYRLALEKFPQAKHIIQSGGNHIFENFDQMIPDIFDFFKF
ncbi:MAG: YqiA/YcfP family alpha/beta fold hydrolase [Pseudomonadota bacterium]